MGTNIANRSNNVVRPSQLADILRYRIAARHSVMISGAPGIGKSDIVDQICKELDVDLIVSHPVVSDPTDYKGLPFLVDGRAKFLPFNDLQAIIDADKPTVFFLDDLGQAPQSVQAACMQLLLARRINGHKVSDYVTFLAATNRRGDRAGVKGILEPVKSRFKAIVELQPYIDDWLKWAATHDMPGVLCGYIAQRPDLLLGFDPSKDLRNSPCPRTIAAVGDFMNIFKDEEGNFDIPRGLELVEYSAAAGDEFANEFVGYLRKYRDLPSIDLVLDQAENIKLPTDISAKYALCGALSHRCEKKNFKAIMTIADRLDPEFSVFLVRDCTFRTPELCKCTEYLSWALGHESLLT